MERTCPWRCRCTLSRSSLAMVSAAAASGMSGGRTCSHVPKRHVTHHESTARDPSQSIQRRKGPGCTNIDYSRVCDTSQEHTS
jgi:hypothetical protein